MQRFLIFLLSVAALAVPTRSWEASTSGNLAITVSPGQAITAVSLSNNNFTGGAPSGTVIGSISVTMSPASPAFSGSLSLSGTNASQFQISAGNLTTNGTVAAGTYQINIVATEAGVSGSPFTQAEAITGTAPTTGVQSPGPSVQLFNNPYYSCVRNYYVATTGNDSSNGSQGSPWRTIGHADSSGLLSAGACVNVSPGLYQEYVAFRHGGNTSSPTGYVVYRCQTLDGCHIQAPSSGNALIFNYANYLMIDGFELDGNNYLAGGSCLEDDTPSGGPAHHLWMMNNHVHHCGLGGITFANTEYGWFIHNEVDHNCYTSGYQGSGINLVTLQPLSGYTPTAMDNQYAPFHNVVAWNNSHDNALGPSITGGHTDGNNIIMDTFHNPGDTGIYPNQTLVEFNLSYNGGGRGIHVFISDNVTVANNTVYHNMNDPLFPRGVYGDLSEQGGGNNVWINNISVSNPGNSNENAVVAGNGGGLTDTNITWQNNVVLGNVALYDNDASKAYWSCSNNKCSTDPKLVNPGGGNFALQSGSPAVGYGLVQGLVQSLLSTLLAVSSDVGACSSALSACP